MSEDKKDTMLSEPGEMAETPISDRNPEETRSTVDTRGLDTDNKITNSPSMVESLAEEVVVESIELTAADHKALMDQAQKAAEYWDLYVRGKAELDNFRKRAARERLDAIRYANEGLLESLLPIMDNFEMALMAAENAANASVESIRTGVSMIYGQMKNLLNDAGLEEIDALGKHFDPNIHEALSEQESDQVEEGVVLQQTRKGYRLRDRLVRPASVVVAKKTASES